MSIEAEGHIDRLVLQYLKKRKFTEAEKVLELEMRAGAGGAPGAPGGPPPPGGGMAVVRFLDGGRAGPDGGPSVEEELAWGLGAEGDPGAYGAAFDALAEWVDGSLDMYRPELSRVLYPLAVHCYMNLVAAGAPADAAALVARHQRRFLEEAGGASALRAQELHGLLSATVPEHLAAQPAARALRARRAGVRLSPAGAALLHRRLRAPGMALLLAVANEHLALEVVEGAAGGPDGGGDDDGSEAALLALAGAEPGGAAAANAAPVDLRLLQGGAEDKWAAQQAERAEQEAQAAAEAEDKSISKKARAALQRAAAAASAAREAVGTNRMAPQVPLPPASEENEAAFLADLAARAAVGPGALPSAVLCTWVNTHQSLCCAAISADGALVAGGFSDSSLRLHDLPASAAAAAAPADGGAAPAGPPVSLLHGHAGPVFSADFSPDASLLFTGSADGSVRLWSMELREGLAAYRGHRLPVWAVAACPAAACYFASGGADRAARLWCTERPKPLRLFVGHQSDVDCVAWHPNAHYLATGASDRSARLWDVRSGGCARLLVGHRAPVTSLAVSPDGARLATGDADGVVSLWDLGTARRLETMASGGKAGHAGPVWSLAWSQGEPGAILASGGADCTVRLWDGASGGAAGAAAQQQNRGGAAAAGAAAGAASAEETGGLPLLGTLRTKATPLFALRFSRRNLLLGSGALSLYRPRPVS